MSGCIDEVQMINLTIFRFVIKGYTLGLDRNSTLPLYIHAVKHLGGHFPVTQGAAQLYEPVGQGRLAMVYMGNYRKIPDVILIHMVLQ